MPSADLSTSLQILLDTGVARGAAPGVVAVAFDRERNFAAAASGVSSIKSQAPMTTDTTLFYASAGKVLISLAALILVERDGFDLDSHEELVKAVPELGKGYPGSRGCIIFDGMDEKGDWKFKEAEKGITLRHLLTHTAGFSYAFGSEEYAWAHAELKKGGSAATAIEMYQLPRLHEAGEAYSYGLHNGHVSLFIVRKSGLSVRRALQQLVLAPLQIPLDSVDVFLTPELRKDLAVIDLRGPDGAFTTLPFHFETPQFEDAVPEGHVFNAEAPAYGRLPAWTGILRAFLNDSAPTPGGKPLLSPELWQLATQDDLAARGLGIQQGAKTPFWTSANPMMSLTTPVWAEAKEEGGDESLGWTLLQTLYHRTETTTGHPAGTLEWAGIANSYYFVNRQRGVGGLITAQYFPFADPKMLELRDEFVRWVYANAPEKKE